MLPSAFLPNRDPSYFVCADLPSEHRLTLTARVCAYPPSTDRPTRVAPARAAKRAAADARASAASSRSEGPVAMRRVSLRVVGATAGKIAALPNGAAKRVDP